MHIGLIMDGNGRWAKQHSLPRAAGHLEGLKACKRVVKAASDFKVDYLSLYVFSTENWSRPEQEVNYLMNLLANKLPTELPFFMENNIKIRFRGNISGLPEAGYKAAVEAEKATKSNTGLTVILCVNYGGRDEITRAVNKIIQNNNLKTVTEENIKNNLDCSDIPDADLIARSAGENRISNFLLWDAAYAEYLCIDTLWPDWNAETLDYCIKELSKRNRKFGGLKT